MRLLQFKLNDGTTNGYLRIRPDKIIAVASVSLKPELSRIVAENGEWIVAETPNDVLTKMGMDT